MNKGSESAIKYLGAGSKDFLCPGVFVKVDVKILPVKVEKFVHSC